MQSVLPGLSGRFGLMLLLGATLVSVCFAAEAGSQKEKINTVRALGRRDARALASLDPYLADPDARVRLETVKAIVRIGSQHSLDPLIRATRDNDAEVQMRATDGLVNFYLPGYVAPSGITGPVARAARQVKGFFIARDNRAVEPWITVRSDVAEAIGGVAQNGVSLEARANAARAAGLLRARPAVPNLEMALRSRDSGLIFESLVALQKIKDESAGPSVSFLAGDLDNRVQITALETIGVLNSKQSAPDVRRAFHNARNAKVSKAALTALALLALPDDRQLFQQYAENGDNDLRIAALEGLGRLREPEDIPLMTRALNELKGDTSLHMAAAFALLSEGDLSKSETGPVQYLLRALALKSRGDDAQTYWEELLRRRDVRQLVIGMMPGLDPQARLRLTSALGMSGAEDALPTLETLERDADQQVSAAASRSIKMIKARAS